MKRVRGFAAKWYFAAVGPWRRQRSCFGACRALVWFKSMRALLFASNPEHRALEDVYIGIWLIDADIHIPSLTLV